MDDKKPKFVGEITILNTIDSQNNIFYRCAIRIQLPNDTQLHELFNGTSNEFEIPKKIIENLILKQSSLDANLGGKSRRMKRSNKKATKRRR